MSAPNRLRSRSRQLGVFVCVLLQAVVRSRCFVQYWKSTLFWECRTVSDCELYFIDYVCRIGIILRFLYCKIYYLYIFSGYIPVYIFAITYLCYSMMLGVMHRVWFTMCSLLIKSLAGWQKGFSASDSKTTFLIIRI